MHLRTQGLWAIEVHLPSEWSSTAITLTRRRQSTNQTSTILWHSASKIICGVSAHSDSGRESNSEMQRVRALFDCGATSIIMTPRLHNWLGISHLAALITILAMTGGVMQHAKDSRKTQITVQYLDYLALVDRSDVLVVPMRAYDLVLGLPWLPKPNPSAKCNSVQKLTAHLPDTPVALTTASKYFQMLLAPPGGLESALRLGKSMLMCFWMHL